jgi:uncharacterized membrane protein YeaQ/YmgE (transglycosylase-associated protein family)
MHILATVVIGGIVGWLAYWRLGLNAERGTIVSVVIGAVGALLGVEVIAPAFVAGPGELFSAPGALVACAAAAAALVAANLVYKRWGL